MPPPTRRVAKSPGSTWRYIGEPVGRNQKGDQPATLGQVAAAFDRAEGDLAIELKLSNFAAGAKFSGGKIVIRKFFAISVEEPDARAWMPKVEERGGFKIVMKVENLTENAKGGRPRPGEPPPYNIRQLLR